MQWDTTVPPGFFFSGLQTSAVVFQNNHEGQSHTDVAQPRDEGSRGNSSHKLPQRKNK